MDYIYGFADTETNLFEQEVSLLKVKKDMELRLLVIKIEDDIRVFKHDTIQEFWKYILSKTSVRKRLIIYFHNLNFDYGILFKFIPKEYGFEYVHNGVLIAVKIYKTYRMTKKDGKEFLKKKIILEFRNSYNLLPMKLGKIAEFVGMEKGNTEKSSLNEREFIQYCINDVMILEKGIKKLFDFVKNNFNFAFETIPLTLPSLAKKIFNKLYMEKYDIEKVSEMEIYDNYEYIRPYYFGGRTEVFDLNIHENVWYNDFNSAYPYVMKFNKFPITKILSETINQTQECEKTLKRLLKDDNFYASILTIEENAQIPLFPERLENGKVIFTVGSKEVLAFRKEIETIVQYPDLFNVLKIKRVFYASQDYIFNEYIDVMYENKVRTKIEGKEFESNMYKLFMNSLYGKFAESRLKNKFEKVDMEKLKYIAESDSIQDIIEINGQFYISKKVNMPTQNNLFIGAQITALARLHLWCYMKRIGFDNVIYCDTDSIVSKILIEDSKELGKMSPEFKAIRFLALNPKEYILEWINPETNEKEIKIKMKGFSKPILNKFEDYPKLWLNPHVIHHVSGFKEMIKRGNTFQEWIEKKKQSFYDKREIDFNTLKTTPLRKEDYEIVKAKNEKIIKMKILHLPTHKRDFLSLLPIQTME